VLRQPQSQEQLGPFAATLLVPQLQTVATVANQQQQQQQQQLVPSGLQDQHAAAEEAILGHGTFAGDDIKGTMLDGLLKSELEMNLNGKGADTVDNGYVWLMRPELNTNQLSNNQFAFNNYGDSLSASTQQLQRTRSSINQTISFADLTEDAMTNSASNPQGTSAAHTSNIFTCHLFIAPGMAAHHTTLPCSATPFECKLPTIELICFKYILISLI
jgi:hypothetical protein